MKKLLATILILSLLSFPNIIYGGIDFDGVDDSVNLGDNYDLVDSAFTVCAWTIPEGSSTGYLMGKYNVTTDSGFWLRRLNSGNDWATGIDSTDFIQVSDSADIGVWQHICSVIDPSPNTSILYKNGVQIGTITTMAATIDSSRDMVIGNRYDINRDYDGTINEVAIWSVVLSQSEIDQLYNSQVKRMPLQIQPSNLEGYWALDEEEDGSSADGDTFRDLSGNGIDGTGNDGANNTGLTAKAEEILSY